MSPQVLSCFKSWLHAWTERLTYGLGRSLGNFARPASPIVDSACNGPGRGNHYRNDRPHAQISLTEVAPVWSRSSRQGLQAPRCTQRRCDLSSSAAFSADTVYAEHNTSIYYETRVKVGGVSLGFFFLIINQVFQ